jgi:hypothetical protein
MRDRGLVNIIFVVCRLFHALFFHRRFIASWFWRHTEIIGTRFTGRLARLTLVFLHHSQRASLPAPWGLGYRPTGSALPDGLQ